MIVNGSPLLDFLRSRDAGGLPGTDDVLGLALPLLEQVFKAHERGHVAPLAGLEKLQVTNNRCWFTEADTHAPRQNLSALSRVEKIESTALEITGSQDIRDNDDGERIVTNKLISKRGQEIIEPVFLPGYISWEHEIDHHDQLTDIFSLGLILASISCNLDLSEDDDLARFVENRTNIFQLNPRLHPVLAKAIVRMTEPRRKSRAQDLNSLIATLTHYRIQLSGPDLNFHRIKGFREANRKGRTQIIQERLRDRLFEISRRNRLLYFRSTMQMLNLTVGSVPVMLDYKTISPDSLCTWQGDFERAISHGETVQLGRYLRFEDAPYLSGVLDQIRNQEARDRTEYGFSQLRLVLAFLRWHNLKDNKEERITSPLVLLPVALERKKGVRDSYTLTPLTTEAEINPVLRHHLKQVYGLQLPEFIDLSQTSLKSFYELLQQQIQRSEPGITLRMLEKPQIKLVHERARARLEQYRRRSRLTGRGVRTLENIDYSYSRENFHPLGLQLFLQRVKPSPSPFDSLVNDDPKPRMMNMAAEAPLPDSSVRERDMYVLQEDTEHNPYVWDFDLCSLTLGNFNYRKMSLVRDYTTLLEQDVANPAFDSVFSLQPKKSEAQALEPLAPEESFQIVPSDPTQMAAVTRARSGSSYIIQGPPGTGKSQTITNLIADYVACGKRVLFVCEKRAAIDVVYHRLKQRGLDRLCCLIHDSQTDKKPFIQDLKATYESYLSTPDGLADAEATRDTALKHMRLELDVLQHFGDAMKSKGDREGVCLRRLYERLIELSNHLPEVSESLAERLPGYAVWLQHGDNVRILARILNDIGKDPVFAKQGLRLLSMNMLLADRPIETITTAIQRTEAAQNHVQQAIAESGLPTEFFNTIAHISTLIAYAEKIDVLARHDLLPLLDKKHPDNERLREAIRKRQALSDKAKAAAIKTANWRDKIPVADLPATIDSARTLEGSFLKFFMPSFRRLRGILNARYNFGAHVVPPKWSSVLKDLQDHYAAEEALAQADAENREYFKMNDLAQLQGLLNELHATEAGLSAAMRDLRQKLLAKVLDPAVISKLLELRTLLQPLLSELQSLFENAQSRSLPEIAADLKDVREALPILPEVLPVLRELLKSPVEFFQLVREQPWTPDQIEAGILIGALMAAYRNDRALPRMDCRVLVQHVERLGAAYQESMSLNAKVVTQRVHNRFREKVDRSAFPAAQLTANEKEWKKAYTKGRRELEHEFGKVMRYRSIRDLSDGETGLVVADLKPIWLMSPLSVSDTLPFTNTSFDVVIFDEASQIPLEEAVPALYRAPQIIVVGDEMQLPPTDFFSSRSEEEEESLIIEEQGERISYELSSDSFLTQAAANLPSTMLGWHYRSRSESLISFSNAAFYNRKLLTIPDVHLVKSTSTITVTTAQSGDVNDSHVLDRPVSFHLVSNGIYEERRNTPEAAYISRLMRSLLLKKTGMSIGIVAFSEAQQGEIESALQALANEDSLFREILDAEFQREENDQFCGLFVKNLENVQGDERDIIILSVCYGQDRQGKMLMNFGPINKNGGEKRLNVVFSRARRHMVLVSSINHSAITNEYNDGANCLKRYLAYAEALSIGQFEVAKRVLQSFAEASSRDQRVETDSVARSIAASLKQRGYVVELDVGDSHFRCNLAVRKSGDQKHRLGVLIDMLPTDRTSILERWLLQPSILQSFDWRITRVTAKDWHHEPAAVLAGIERECSAE